MVARAETTFEKDSKLLGLGLGNELETDEMDRDRSKKEKKKKAGPGRASPKKRTIRIFTTGE